MGDFANINFDFWNKFDLLKITFVAFYFSFLKKKIKIKHRNSKGTH